MWNLSAYLVIHSDNNSSLPQTGQKKKLLLENVKYGGPIQLTFKNPPKQLVKFEKCEWDEQKIVSLSDIFRLGNSNKTSSKKSPFFAISVLASAAVEGCWRTKVKLVTKYTYQLIYILLYILLYMLLYMDMYMAMRQLSYGLYIFDLLTKQHLLPTPLLHISLDNREVHLTSAPIPFPFIALFSLMRFPLTRFPIYMWFQIPQLCLWIVHVNNWVVKKIALIRVKIGQNIKKYFFTFE